MLLRNFTARGFFPQLPCMRNSMACRIRPGGKNMKSYEMLYVIDNSVADEAKDALVQKFEGIVTSMGGELVSTDRTTASLCL